MSTEIHLLKLQVYLVLKETIGPSEVHISSVFFQHLRLWILSDLKQESSTRGILFNFLILVMDLACKENSIN